MASQSTPERLASIARWKKENPERVATARASYYERAKADGRIRDSYLRRKFGITADQERLLLEYQERTCAICGAGLDEPATKNTHLDHDHETGAVRGFLCLLCNHGLGHFRDDPALLARAVEYLADPPARAIGVDGLDGTGHRQRHDPQRDLKLDAQAKAEIQERHAAGGISQRALASEYGVSQSYICLVVKEQT